MNFQNSSKPWAAGEFTLNVNIGGVDYAVEEHKHELGELWRGEPGHYRINAALTDRFDGAGIIDIFMTRK